MAKIQPQKLSAHGLGREIVDHYSSLFARRIAEKAKKNKKKQKSKLRKAIIKEKLQENKSIPKQLKDKFQVEIEPGVLDIAKRALGLSSKTLGTWKNISKGISVEERVRTAKSIDLQEETDKSIPDILNERIREKVKQLLEKKSKLDKQHTNSKEFKLLIAEEIEQEIAKEEQRDLQEKVVLRRRRKVIRKKQKGE